MDSLEFLKADILCLLYDYGEMSAEEIESMLGAGIEDVEDALFDLVFEEKLMEVSKGIYDAVDEINVKRLKNEFPEIF